ncbi:MAG: tetratricopeptide repeat protein, partial [Acidobacteriota bacterium]
LNYKYNPQLMFNKNVVLPFYENLLNELVSSIRQQREETKIQHVIISAPRGLGKTSLLLAVQNTIINSELSQHWQIIPFPEEPYAINDLTDYWFEVLYRLALLIKDPVFSEKVSQLKIKHTLSRDLQEAAKTLLRTWRQQEGKKLALFIDNLDTLFDQINSEQEREQLCETLQTDKDLLLIGTSSNWPSERLPQSFDKLFKIYHLTKLTADQTQQLWQQQAALDGYPDFAEKFNTYKPKLRLLEHFVCGNPRLALTVYHLIIENQEKPWCGLENLLDEVTPNFKAKIDNLPPQQRKLLVEIARISGKTNEGLTPTELAVAARLPVTQVSAQLKRLLELRYIRLVKLPGRNSYYTLSEPLYAIWQQMRCAPETHQRIKWLINFMKVWYELEDLGQDRRQIIDLLQDQLVNREMEKAYNILQILELKDYNTLKELLAAIGWEHLSQETLKTLHQTGFITKQEADRVPTSANLAEMHSLAEALAALQMGLTAFSTQQWEEACRYFEQSLKYKPDLYRGWLACSIVFERLNKYEEAINSLNKALDINPEIPQAWLIRAKLLIRTGRYEEALASYEHILKTRPTDAQVLLNRGAVLAKLARYAEARACFDRVLANKPDLSQAWFNRAITSLLRLTEHIYQDNTSLAEQDWQEALQSLRQAIQLTDELIGHKIISIVLSAIAQRGKLKFAQQMLADSNLNEQFFPLARAIDYLYSGEEALLDKLSPEVRSMVSELVDKLRKFANLPETSSIKATLQRKSGPRRRSTKLLQ